MEVCPAVKVRMPTRAPCSESLRGKPAKRTVKVTFEVARSFHVGTTQCARVVSTTDTDEFT
eukprot:1735032-Rhodomonas_salina.1